VFVLELDSLGATHQIMILSVSRTPGSIMAKPGAMAPGPWRGPGPVKFATFLAVRDTQSGAIVTLGELAWALSWDGMYDFANARWPPADPAAVIVITRGISWSSRVLPDPAVVELPFSLGRETAKGHHQIRTSEGWLLGQEGLPSWPAMPQPRAE
jgi:hypothetical protein